MNFSKLLHSDSVHFLKGNNRTENNTLVWWTLHNLPYSRYQKTRCKMEEKTNFGSKKKCKQAENRAAWQTASNKSKNRQLDFYFAFGSEFCFCLFSFSLTEIRLVGQQRRKMYAEYNFYNRLEVKFWLIIFRPNKLRDICKVSNPF